MIGTHLLSLTYDRDLSNVLKVQDEIAIHLTGQEKAPGNEGRFASN